MCINRRALLGLGLTAGAVSVAGCASGTPVTSGGPTPGASESTGSNGAKLTAGPSGAAATASTGPEKPWGEPNVKLGAPIGDGSMAPSPDPQPFQRPITKLAKGETPPQFVVFSWDGASGNENHILDFVKAAHSVNGTMTLFTSALYFLPQSLRTEYKPPRRPAGASDIPYMSDLSVRRTIVDTAIAWTYGNEIGTHFCGHFGGTNGVGSWSTADWEQEMEQVYKLVTTWRTITGWTDIDPLPFDYTKELVGSRTPLLEGRDAMLPVAKERGWRYDSSGVRTVGWPKKDARGIYDMSMFSVPFKGGMGLPMDYNYYFSATKATNTGTAAQRATWKEQHKQSLRDGLQMCLKHKRAPLIIGNHLSPWLGGIYQDNLYDLILEFGKTPGVQLVSHRWLCDWLDAQDPEVLAALQA